MPGESNPSLIPIRLRPTAPADIPTLFEHQCDPEANQLAGTKPRTLEVFEATWERIFKDPSIIPRTIIADDGAILGGINRFKADGLDAVGYWIAKEHWGKKIASRALTLFLKEVTLRPLHATAARANTASLRILQSNGFRITGYEMGEETDRYLPREIARFILD